MATSFKAAVELDKVSFAYEGSTIVKEVNLKVDPGEFVVLVGPSGCGKSTLMRLVSGLETPQEGFIRINGSHAGSQKNNLRYLFQDYDAFPWLTIKENVQKGSGPRPFPDIKIVEDIIDRVGLKGHEKKYPEELSGGMRKRLALARCLVRRPKLLLLDEPFSSLDTDARYELYKLLQEMIHCKNSNLDSKLNELKISRGNTYNTGTEDTKNKIDGTAVIMITHNLEEAVLMADRVLVSKPLPFRIDENDSIDVEIPRPRDRESMNRLEFNQLLSRLHHKMFKFPIEKNAGP